MKYKLFVFDLDGTLMSSHKTILQATKRAFKDLNITKEIDEERFNKLIGHHFEVIFEDQNIEVPDIEHFIKVFKGYYFDYIQDSEIYPGTVDVLKKLKAEGKKVALLTTKGQDQAELIIDMFKLNPYFDMVMGRIPELPIKPAPEPLLKIAEELKTDIQDTVMVGDTEMDIQCAKNAGAKSCAVTFGYRTPEQIELEKPNFIINSYNQFFDVII